ncbi:hypothetical protein B0H63DRAFT_470980 [Podospora didyma]|uniref:Uncharacterized protein n=1 Tax=Podospora didyma TaxID=330526 RepID=A0AAE0NUM5_9PEZI|nr:hypothetical protein B0H63DRAFT_470980 [Podospora didyma]
MQMMETNNPGFNSQRRRHPHAATWQHMSQDVYSFGEDITLDKLLRRYSPALKGPIPSPRKPQQQHQYQQLQQQQSLHRDLNTLQGEDVSFYVLGKMLNIQITWTTSICEHLEFDARAKQLKMFGLPSYCVLLCLLKPEKTYLDALIGNLLGFDNENEAPDVASSANFFCEILSTYRLIFGQHKDARALMKKYCARGRLFGKFKSPFYGPHPSAFPSKDDSASATDPLLKDLCSKDSRDLALFADLDMVSDLRNLYTLDTDFPYFAERLSHLHQFVQNQLPQDWKILRRERRELRRYWTIWVAMISQLAAVVLGVIGVILGGIQVQIAQRAEAALSRRLEQARNGDRERRGG